ncbi:MAG TPA: SH3 domain-containing protein [Pyrinomonadaceae bacterium]|nr:SH3 domain-containing protein [Pyrinomonadaceae bacterium]
MKKTIIFGFLVLTFCAQAVSAQRYFIDDYNAIVKKYKCVLEGWIEDKDPKGTNVRNAPSIKGKIIDVLPFEDENSDEPQGSYYILGYSNGWVKILLPEVVNDEYKIDKTGWVSAKLITSNVQTKSGKPANLYSLPNRKSKKVGKIPSENLIKIVGFDCFGFKIEYKGIVGWISSEDVCGNPLTTCA